jgi:hypothetical protein
MEHGPEPHCTLSHPPMLQFTSQEVAFEQSTVLHPAAVQLILQGMAEGH